MFTMSKLTEIFCIWLMILHDLASRQEKIYDLRLEYKHCNKLNSMNDAEVMVILYCFIPVVSAFSDIITKNTYVNIRKHLFMWQIFYNCFVELENEV